MEYAYFGNPWNSGLLYKSMELGSMGRGQPIPIYMGTPNPTPFSWGRHTRTKIDGPARKRRNGLNTTFALYGFGEAYECASQTHEREYKTDSF